MLTVPTTASDSPSNAAQPRQPSTQIPPGAPSWVTAELIEHTIRVWQPRYPSPLTADDALYIILNVGQLIQVLSRGNK